MLGKSITKWDASKRGRALGCRIDRPIAVGNGAGKDTEHCVLHLLVYNRHHSDLISRAHRAAEQSPSFRTLK